MYEVYNIDKGNCMINFSDSYASFLLSFTNPTVLYWPKWKVFKKLVVIIIIIIIIIIIALLAYQFVNL
jgi:hypothetical protein